MEHTASSYDPHCNCEWCERELQEAGRFFYELSKGIKELEEQDVKRSNQQRDRQEETTEATR